MASDHFQVSMPGDPPSWNHMYRWTSTKVPDGRGGTRFIRTQAKEKGVELYQSQLSMIVRAAKPTGFDPQGQIIIAYDLRMTGNKDADNVMKACNDAIAAGLGVNDRRFLPVVVSLETRSRDPWTTIGIYDATRYKLAIILR